MTYSRLEPPTPIVETPNLVAIEDSYGEDFNMIPQDGFLHDFYYRTLGWGINNLYAFWTGIAGLSALASREVKLRSAMDLYPNFYIILVGPPGLGHKSTAMNEWERIESVMWSYLPSHLKEIKKVPMIRGKATPEFVFTTMANHDLNFSRGKESNAVLKIRVSELNNFMSKSTYNQTLVSKLTDFYDCRDFDTDGVLGRNNGQLAEIRNIYSTLFGCTTPDSLKETFPSDAFGGGFMSRVTMVNANIDMVSKRIIDWPYYPEDSPSQDDLAEKLAWIATNKNGEYSLTPKAFTLYRKWYAEVYQKILEKARKGDSDDRDNRVTTQALKLATLLSYQRYSLDRRVTWDDMLSAINIVDYTMLRATSVIDDVAVTFSEDRRILRFYRKLKEAGKKGITQRDLCRNSNYKVGELSELFKELKAKGLARVAIDGRAKTYFVAYDQGESE